MKYLVALQYRNWKREIVQFVHPVPFDDIAAAETALPELAEKHKAMGWIIEIKIPEFRPPFKLVQDVPPADENCQVIDGGKLLIN